MSFTADTISGVDPFATPLRVLHVLQPTEAGVWRYASDMAQFQSDHGWQVHVASPVRPDADVPWLQWQAVRNPAKGVRDESRRLRGIVGQVRPDAVVAHSSKAGLVVRSTVPRASGRRPRRPGRTPWCVSGRVKREPASPRGSGHPSSWCPTRCRRIG